MALELHIWGPAFGLPSIDADCVAAVAFLNSTLEYNEWTLVAAHDPSYSPSKNFPALKDGATWIGGYHAIVRHIRGTHASHLDASLASGQAADRTAYSALLDCHGLPLIDLSLYVSYENYSSVTRPAYTRILPWHGNYIVPPARREAARTRTAHLGLSSLDVDTTHESLDLNKPSQRFEAEKRAAGLSDTPGPKSQSILPLGRKKGLRGLLGSPQYAARFKLDALANTVLEPLSDLLGDKQYLLTDDQPSSLDCLALGYLSLMYYPPIPQPFLCTTIDERFPTLQTYTTRLRDILLGGEVRVDAVLALNDVPRNADDIQRARDWKLMKLPWNPSPPSTFAASTHGLGTEILASLPLTSHLVKQPHITHADPVPPPTLASSIANNILPIVTGVAALAAAVIYQQFAHARRSDHLVFERDDVRRHISPQYGEAGSFLSALGNQMYYSQRAEEQRRRQEAEREPNPIVGVDVRVSEAQPGENIR